MLVELDIFSGRPNPRWQLDERTSRELRELLRRLRRSVGPAIEPAGLGYRGFSWTDGRRSGRVYKGFVRAGGAVFADPALSTERFLVEKMPAEFAYLRERVESELGRRR
jgi:hypothetical protein